MPQILSVEANLSRTCNISHILTKDALNTLSWAPLHLWTPRVIPTFDPIGYNPARSFLYAQWHFHLWPVIHVCTHPDRLRSFLSRLAPGVAQRCQLLQGDPTIDTQGAHILPLIYTWKHTLTVTKLNPKHAWHHEHCQRIHFHAVNGCCSVLERVWG